MAISSFIVIALSGEDMTRRIGTLVLAIALVVLGVLGIRDYQSK